MYSQQSKTITGRALAQWFELGLVPLRGEKGFGLSESLVAVALLGTVIIALTGALSTGSIGVGAAREGATAQSLAQSQLAYTKSYPFDSGTNTYPTVDTYHTTYNPHPLNLPSGYSISVAVANTQDVDNEIQKVTATIIRGGTAVMMLEDFKVNR